LRLIFRRKRNQLVEKAIYPLLFYLDIYSDDLFHELDRVVFTAFDPNYW